MENPEESWHAIIKEIKDKYSLFPEMRGAYFLKTKKGIHYQNVMPIFNHFTDLPDNNEIITLKLSFQERC